MGLCPPSPHHRRPHHGHHKDVAHQPTFPVKTRGTIANKAMSAVVAAALWSATMVPLPADAAAAAALTKQDLKEIVAEAVTSIDTKFDAIDTKFDAINAKFDAIDTKFDAIDTKFDAINAKFDAIETKFDTKFDAIETKFDTKFDAMEKAMNNRFDQQDNMFMSVPYISAGFSAVSAVVAAGFSTINVAASNNKLDNVIASFTNEKENIKKNWRQGLKPKQYKAQS